MFTRIKGSLALYTLATHHFKRLVYPPYYTVICHNLSDTEPLTWFKRLQGTSITFRGQSCPLCVGENCSHHTLYYLASMTFYHVDVDKRALHFPMP